MTAGQEVGGHPAPNMGIPTANSGFPSGYPISGSTATGGLASLLPQSQSTLSPAASGSSVNTKSQPDSDLGGLRGSLGVPPGSSGFDNNSGGAGTVIDPATGLPISASDLPPLTVNSELALVVRSMLMPDSGLEIHDRTWLKITIPNAVIGSDLVEWLYAHVEGFQDRREVRRYAANLLKFGFIHHTVNKSTFSEQCYYVFTDINSAAFHNLNLEELDSVSEIGGGVGGGGSGGGGGRHSHSSTGVGSYLPSIFNQPTSASAVSTSTMPSGMPQPPFWNPVGSFSQPPPAQQVGALFSPYPQQMMYPPVSQPPGGYSNPEDGRLHLNSSGSGDHTGGVNQSCLTSEALTAVSRGMNGGSQSTSGSSGSSSSSASSSCSSEKMISPQMKPNQSNLSTALPSSTAGVVSQPGSLGGIYPVPSTQPRPLVAASVHSGSVYGQPCSCLNILRRHSKKKNQKKKALEENVEVSVQPVSSYSSLHPSSTQEQHRPTLEKVPQDPGTPASQPRGASTASENRSAGSGVSGAPTRLLPPRPNDSTSSAAQGCINFPSSVLPPSPNTTNNSNNMASFRSPPSQSSPMSGGTTSNQPMLPLSSRIGGGSLADLTKNSSTQPGNATQRIN